MAFILLIVLLLLFGAPTEAFAWGIGVHLQLGSNILNNLNQLPPSLQFILQEHPLEVLYGCISADITLG